MTHPVRRPANHIKTGTGSQRTAGPRNCPLVSTDSFVPVASVADVGPGSALAVEVGGRDVALFNVDGTFYAIENSCPHQGAPLVDGWVEGTTVTCTWHAWCFNLTDGSMTLGSFAQVDPYDVRVENGQIFVSRTPRAAGTA
jgi:nitrite reductase (NADH) small subunit